MRLIDADALKGKIYEEWFSGYPADIFVGYIEDAPTIDPVKHGKWIVIPQRCESQTFDECKCSVCGTAEYFNSGWKKFVYCPTCGARMETDE